jgi:predicted  nucleic acid-binding Zn-ribbon protein
VNADAAAQLRLLDLQGIDTTLAQLRHRRATLPELSLIAAALGRADDVRTRQLDVRTALDDTSGDQRRLENEVDAVRARTTRDSERLTAGSLPAKELEGLQHEITSLARRQSSLEDELLEVMEQRETRELELSALDAELAGIEAERQDHEAARERAFAEIEAATTQHQAQRSQLTEQIPPDLLALYEKVAAAGGGVGAAMVKQRRCEGCHLELAGSELISVRAAADDAVLRCENCRRILVRTAESGL